MKKMLNPKNENDWGPGVQYVRVALTPKSANELFTEIEVGRKYCQDIVTSIKFVNEGTNSSVQVGRDGLFETMSSSISPEVSFGEGFPMHIEDKFKIIFTATGASPIHLVMAVMAVVKLNC